MPQIKVILDPDVGEASSLLLIENDEEMLIDDLVTRLVDQYNRKFKVKIEPKQDSPFVIIKDGSRHPQQSAITTELRTIGSLMKYFEDKKKIISLVYHLHVDLIFATL